MIIEFDKINEEVLPNFKGGEKCFHAKMFYDGMNRIMKASLEPGASIGLHTHDVSSEIIFITKGTGHVLYEGEKIRLKAGDVHYCPKGHSHSLVNDSESVLEISAVVPQQ